MLFMINESFDDTLKVAQSVAVVIKKLQIYIFKLSAFFKLNLQKSVYKTNNTVDAVSV